MLRFNACLLPTSTANINTYCSSLFWLLFLSIAILCMRKFLFSTLCLAGFFFFCYLALCSYWLLFRMQITECHGNERALKKKGKIMLSSNCLLFVRKCVKYMTWKYFQNGLWLSFWCIFLLLSKGVGTFPIGKYKYLLIIQVLGIKDFFLHPFMEIRNYEPGCLAHSKISIQYNFLHKTLAPLKSMAKVIAFSWSGVSLLFLIFIWIFTFLYKYLSR